MGAWIGGLRAAPVTPDASTMTPVVHLAKRGCFQRQTTRWPQGIVPYQMHPALNDNQRLMIRQAMDVLEFYSARGVQFVEQSLALKARQPFLLSACYHPGTNVPFLLIRSTRSGDHMDALSGAVAENDGVLTGDATVLVASGRRRRLVNHGRFRENSMGVLGNTGSQNTNACDDASSSGHQQNRVPTRGGNSNRGDPNADYANGAQDKYISSWATVGCSTHVLQPDGHLSASDDRHGPA